MRFKAQIDGVEHRIAASPSGALSIGSDSFRATVGRPSAMRRLVKVGKRRFVRVKKA